jgi:hypothetical protein
MEYTNLHLEITHLIINFLRSKGHAFRLQGEITSWITKWVPQQNVYVLSLETKKKKRINFCLDKNHYFDLISRIYEKS